MPITPTTPEIPSNSPTPGEGALSRAEAPPEPPPGLLARMRIRKKLMLLHTVFSLGLAVILLASLRPAITEVVRRAERSEADAVARLAAALVAADPGLDAAAAGPIASADLALGVLELGDFRPEIQDRLADNPSRTPVPIPAQAFGGSAAAAALYVPEADRVVVATARMTEARQAVTLLYILLTVALIAVYGLVALSLEVFVLPRHVYGPIRRMRQADIAVQEGRREAELIPDSDIPRDELGEIMRSRNQSVLAIRQQERQLADAFDRIEIAANDLRRKNHLLERARQNLASADRLASLGMMSAGIAHELNTPLSVLKGLVEKLHDAPSRGVPEPEAALMLRVVRRLERLSESLLDFARARPPSTSPTDLRAVVDEAVTLVRIDREASSFEFLNRVPEGLVLDCDADRIMQVLVNLVRNAVDARRGSHRPEGGASAGRVVVEAEPLQKDGSRWVSLTVTDDGPGINAQVLSTLFDPFVSTRLDSRGTGLGLAVAEGIIHEHGGVILAKNRPERAGAVFEILLPSEAASKDPPTHAPAAPDPTASPERPAP
ncbi:MAG: hypothetical protein EA378_04185 [Phycisphaerales bacterium]|nr:MAG: hypothetical protein EA378_04185 [Phycisphaerales bacterium]